MTDKLLTIIIPTYNMEKYLDKCLTSLIVSDPKLLQQLEVLVINDGSKDASSSIGHSYERLYPNTFKVIDKENGNYGSCVNHGLKVATGKFVKILDADDWFDTQKFELFMSFLRTTQADLVLSDFEMVNPSGETIRTYHYSLRPDQHTMLNNYVVWGVWMHAVTYRLDIFNDLNYHQTEGISHTDIEWIFLPMTRVKSVEHFPHVVYKYLIGREGQTQNPKVLMREFSHEIKGWKVIQSTWEHTAIIGRGDAEGHLWCRLLIRAEYIYECSILGCLKGYRKQDLLDFDTYVMIHNKKIYDELERSSYHHNSFRYIHYWRKWHHCSLLVMIVMRTEDLARQIVESLKHNVKKVIGRAL